MKTTSRMFILHSLTNGSLWYQMSDIVCNCQATRLQITGYGMSVGDHRVGWWWKGVMGKRNSYMTLIGVHSTTYLMHPNWCRVTIICRLLAYVVSGTFVPMCSSRVEINSCRHNWPPAKCLIQLSSAWVTFTTRLSFTPSSTNLQTSANQMCAISLAEVYLSSFQLLLSCCT